MQRRCLLGASKPCAVFCLTEWGYQGTGNRPRSRRKRCAIRPEPVARHLPCMRDSALRNDPWLRRGSFSHLHLNLHLKATFSDTGTVASYECSSPHRMAPLQSMLTLPHRIDFNQDSRFMSRLPAQNISSYQTMDTHLASTCCKHFTIAGSGRSLVQPHHREFTGDNGNAVGIRRRLYASLTWRQ